MPCKSAAQRSAGRRYQRQRRGDPFSKRTAAHPHESKPVTCRQDAELNIMGRSSSGGSSGGSDNPRVSRRTSRGARPGPPRRRGGVCHTRRIFRG
ncbi:unnamed protein product, partial [Laminaria digitata]